MYKKKIMSSEKNRQMVLFMTFNAFCLAINFLLGFTRLGFIDFGVLTITLLHITAMAFASYSGFKYSWIYGFLFGFTSWLVSFTSPTGFNMIFRNPLVSITPRVLFILFFAFFNDLIRKYLPKNARYALLPILSFVSTIIHTMLVLIFLLIFGRQTLLDVYQTDSIAYVVSMMCLLAMLPEAAAAFIAVPLIVLPTENIVRRMFFGFELNKKYRARVNSRFISSSVHKRRKISYFVRENISF